MSNVPALFNHALLAARRSRALAQPDAFADAGFLRQSALSDLTERLDAVNRSFVHALDVDAPDRALAEALLATGKVETVSVGTGFAGADIDRPRDETGLLLGDRNDDGGQYDLVTSVLSLQFANDLPGVLIQFRRALKPDGLFLGAVFGGDTLFELREVLLEAESEILGGAAPRVLPFGEVRDMGALLQRAGFGLPVADIDTLVVRYGNPLRLLSDLRAMGATNILKSGASRPLRRDVLLRAMALYKERFSEADGKVPATFQIVSLSGWAPHESQQKPLQPGSAKTRLADALGVAETPAGEKTGQ
ncbi:SAM-dependent methyltransferase [Pararhizobium sp. IMCC21322]|uniref:SAM-dependent methyltransferase n=1 Tax=Pararhizobium sp. IMCC21322 TaxID=3067903 RepID=UPI0027409F6C|nr:SAM-dependent methyltransferase [Pararhizobium sp. IMCC21322]